MLFADLLSLHLITLLIFFILFVSLFLAADACLSWNSPSITEQQVCASYAVLAEESSTRPGFLQTLPTLQLYL